MKKFVFIIFFIVFLFNSSKGIGKVTCNVKKTGYLIAELVLNKDFSDLKKLLNKHHVPNAYKFVMDLESMLKFAIGKKGVKLLLYERLIKNKFEKAIFIVSFKNLVLFLKVEAIEGKLRNVMFNTSGRKILGYNVEVIKPLEVKEDKFSNYIESIAHQSTNLYQFYQNLYSEISINVEPDFSYFTKKFKITFIKQCKIAYKIGPVEERYFYIIAHSKDATVYLLCKIDFFKNQKNFYINSFDCEEKSAEF